MAERDGYYLVLISVHGLIRAQNPELGRDADTGGQVLYVLELARALAARPEVERVDLLTRKVVDSKVDPDYSRELEEIAPGAHLVRLECGPRRYLRKEVLWPHLEVFADQAMKHFRRVGRIPDVVHSHYADAGFVGSHLSGFLGIPLIHTGHSLGHCKRNRLLEKGMRWELIESQYNMQTRIEAEETALDNAAVVIASTNQEVNEQYNLYDHYQPGRMVVIPPGVDLARFHPPRKGWQRPPVQQKIERFLEDPAKPLILAMSRADSRKNVSALVHAYGQNRELQERANLVLVLGNRDIIAEMERESREVLSEVIQLVDRYDLYGRVAYPKHHDVEDVPDLYRLASYRRGLFVNPALTEPFGLTLLEAAASGLPVVATNDGGPRDIIGACKNGLLIGPLDTDAMGKALLDGLCNRERWKQWSRNGVKGAHRFFSWSSHVGKYLGEIKKLVRTPSRDRALSPLKSRLPLADRLLVSDIDNTLLGDDEGLAALLKRLRETDQHVGFAIATGRSLESVLEALKKKKIPLPDILLTSVGTEIHYGPRIIRDTMWERHIDYRWEPEAIRKVLGRVRGLKLQPKEAQRTHKISYFVTAAKFPSLREIRRQLRKENVSAKLIYSHKAFLDVLPVRASKGRVLRYLALKWGIPVDRILVAGDSGNDEEMLCGDTLGVVVGNYSPELSKLKGRPRIYFAEAHHARGILEGIERYDFLGELKSGVEEESERVSKSEIGMNA